MSALRVSLTYSEKATSSYYILMHAAIHIVHHLQRESRNLKYERCNYLGFEERYRVVDFEKVEP